MNRALRIAGVLLGIISCGYFLAFVYRTGTHNDLRALLTWRMMSAGSLAALAFALVIPASSWAWGRLLESIGVRIPLLRLNMIMGITQIAKYVPGNVAQHVGRVAMSIKQGLPVDATIVTLVSETTLAVATAVAVGALALCLGVGGLPNLSEQQHRLVEFAVLAAILLTLLAALGARNLPTIVRALSRQRSPAVGSSAPTPAAMFAAAGAYTLNYVAIGLGLSAMLHAAWPGRADLWALATGAFALSWVVGTLMPGLPAGLGAREGAMLAFLSPVLDASSALHAVIGLRIAATAGDLLALAWGATLHFLGPRAPSASSKVTADPSNAT